MAQPTDTFDVLVVGGGIVGAGTAALAAQAGLRVALLERGDFGGATSSASSKLIHGGLRYLRMGDFRLVREALAEARVLAELVAPHLVRELGFVLPVYEDGPYGRAAIGAALAGYRLLGGRRGRAAPPGALRREGLRSVGVYADAQTNDARLVLANVRAAADAGALVSSRCAVTGIERGPHGLLVHADALELHARTVVNASGPWVDDVRRLEDPRAGTSVSLSKGVHLVLDLPDGLDVALTIPVDRSRVSFALPWEGMLLLGTTDTEVEERDVTVTEAEVEQILAEASRALEVRRESVRASFAGLRVLPLSGRSTVRRRREVTLSRGPLGMLSVAGGKLTTYRLIARRVLGALGFDVPRTPVPLPGAGAVAADVPPHLARAYGSLAHEVLAYRDALEPLVPGEPELVAQVLYARDREWAVDADDVLRRRTTLALRGLDTPELRARVQALLDGSALAGALQRG